MTLVIQLGVGIKIYLHEDRETGTRVIGVFMRVFHWAFRVMEAVMEQPLLLQAA